MVSYLIHQNHNLIGPEIKNYIGKNKMKVCNKLCLNLQTFNEP